MLKQKSLKKKLAAIMMTMLIMVVATAQPIFAANPSLGLWRQDALSTTCLTEYVQAVTLPGSKDFIPVSARIAVFDLDGTLYNETSPTYFDSLLYLNRVMFDKGYKATKHQKDLAFKIADEAVNGVKHEGAWDQLNREYAAVFAGMTPEELQQYTRAFMQTPVEGYAGLLKGNAFYLPMLQLINYLQQNGFKVYVCSGTQRILVRTLIEGKINIPPSQVIGSDTVIEASGQGSADPLDYAYDKSKDSLVIDGKTIVKNLDMNKVTAIQREIGQKPVLAFGNSGSDSSMVNYTLQNNPYRSAGFMLLCDDTVRENGNPKKAESMLKSCTANGWVPISMKNDFLTIYGPGVVRTP
ncbi:MAG: haloacid dehalogenase-like hydrolase [Lachnospiraceae bacterium]|nr:haloacid dehalogenase-like hydrolase [Lachnospiraceae bacterium]